MSGIIAARKFVEEKFRDSDIAFLAGSASRETLRSHQHPVENINSNSAFSIEEKTSIS